VLRGKSHPPWLVWIALSAILAAYVAAVVNLHPTNFFGLSEDDSLYFSSAKALAQGQGYVLPSFPGTPPATKYPVLYPLILSVVWRLNSSFPANLSWAIAVTTTFGLVYVLTGFFFIRCLMSLTDTEALLLTAFCALHPLTIFYSANVLSDVPFAALALMAMLLADSFLKPDSKIGLVVTCGIVSGLSMTMRAFGMAVVAGILLFAAARHAWKKMFVFAACASPFFLVIAWHHIFSSANGVPVRGLSATSLGWVRAWAYYTSYIAMWKLSVPNVHIFWAMVLNNLELVAQGPADLFLSPLLVSDTMLGRALVLLVSALTFAGIVRQAADRGLRAFHYMLPFFVVMILFWNYSDAGNRFLLSFYFAFVGGLWVGIRHITGLLRSTLFNRTSPASEKILAVVLATAILFLGAGIALNYAVGRRRDVWDLSQRRGGILRAKQEAYHWLAQRTTDRECCAPVLAVEDANLYLYSGRTAVSPVLTFATSTLYEDVYLNESVGHLMDVAKAVNAEYWVFADDDFSMESKNVSAAVRSCLGPAGPSDWPVVFKSNDGRVVIRSLIKTPGYINPCRSKSGGMFSNSSPN
jgi:hypothetical protein